MKRLLLWVFICQAAVANAQTLTLERCYEMAIDYATLATQRSLQRSLSTSNQKAVAASLLPQADLNMQATYQSDVIALPISMPGVDIPILSKDQYRATVDLKQVIYDGGYVAKQKKVMEHSLLVENIKLDISLSALKDKVSGVYLGILLTDENLKITRLIHENISSNITRMEHKKAEGVVLKNNLDLLYVERMRVEQRMIEMESSRALLLEMLSSFIGVEVTTSTIITLPLVQINQKVDSKRPEYQLFKAQLKELDAKKRLINSKNMPKILAFASAGYGRPGLNPMNNDFASMFLAGANLSVPLTKWTLTKQEKRAMATQQQLIGLQEIDFSRKNRSEILNQLTELNKYQKLIQTDASIVAKQEDIVASQEQRLLNGVITSTDYIVDLNAKKEALLNQKLHQIQLIQTQIAYNSLTGNNP